MRQKLLGHLQGDQSPRGPTPEEVRSARLDLADGGHVLLSHLLQPAGKVRLAVQAARSDAVEGPLPAQPLR